MAAWGDPAIIARCGLDPLGSDDQDCVTVDGVDWVVRQLTDGSAATTYGRDPAIEVLAPGPTARCRCSCRPSPSVAKSLPANGRHCS